MTDQVTFDEERLYQILLAPVVSEKSTRLADANRQFVFRVLPTATKAEVRAAIEMLFKVNVKSIQVLNVRGKTKRTGKHVGMRSNWKKAYVRLGEGQDIDFMGT